MATEPGAPSRARYIERDIPYAWQERRALERIRKELRSTSAVLVYVALTEAESHAKGGAFQIEVKRIAGLAGLRYSATSKWLRELRRIGLVSVKGNKIRGTKINAANTYTLRPTPHRDEAPHSGEGQDPHREDTESVKTQESSKDSTKEQETAALSSASASPDGGLLDGAAKETKTQSKHDKWKTAW